MHGRLVSRPAATAVRNRHAQVMHFTAECFDAPPDSDKHAGLRDSAWMGGDLVEGRYLLGMLTRENLFKVSDSQYVRKLRSFVSTNVSASAANIFCRLPACQCLIPYLRRLYHTQTTYTPMPSRNDRVEAAVAHFLHNLDASDAEIAAAIGTTEKQVLRISDLSAARKTVRLYRESKSR